MSVGEEKNYHDPNLLDLRSSLTRSWLCNSVAESDLKIPMKLLLG